MARREYLLGTTITVDDASGSAREFDLVRISVIIVEPASITINWECGRNNKGVWQPIGSIHQGTKTYEDSDYDNFIKLTSAALGEKHLEKLEDQIFTDLYNKGSGPIGKGKTQNYSF